MSTEHKEFDIPDLLRATAWAEIAGSIVIAYFIWTTPEKTEPLHVILGFISVGFGLFFFAVLFALAALLQEARPLNKNKP